MEFINQRLDNADAYQTLLQQQREILMEKYLTCSVMVDHILPEDLHE